MKKLKFALFGGLLVVFQLGIASTYQPPFVFAYPTAPSTQLNTYAENFQTLQQNGHKLGGLITKVDDLSPDGQGTVKLGYCSNQNPFFSGCITINSPTLSKKSGNIALINAPTSSAAHPVYLNQENAKNLISQLTPSNKGYDITQHFSAVAIDAETTNAPDTQNRQAFYQTLVDGFNSQPYSLPVYIYINPNLKDFTTEDADTLNPLIQHPVSGALPNQTNLYLFPLYGGETQHNLDHAIGLIGNSPFKVIFNVNDTGYAFTQEIAILKNIVARQLPNFKGVDYYEYSQGTPQLNANDIKAVEAVLDES